MQLPYKLNDKNSIIKFAKLLKNKTLREVCDPSILNHKYKGKGNFGQVLEKYYFLYEPNSDSEPDFVEAGLELKSSPLKLLKNKEYRSKERLVLNIINYEDIVYQTFESSTFWKKNAHLLLVFFLHAKGSNILDYIIKLIDEWKFPDTDLEIIKRDWKIILQKVLDGKAHEISEADTFYLSACTKGSSKKTVRTQPFSKILAKQRAFSFKQGYVNHILATKSGVSDQYYGKLIPSINVAKKNTLEEIVLFQFEKYYGKTINEILKKLNLHLNLNAKNFYANLTKAILGVELNKQIEEFEKAEIIVKTVRLKENNLPKEDLSFPNFKYLDLATQSWDESDIKNLLNHKFLFVFFQYSEGELVLRKIKFWNMPYGDIQEVKKVWAKTKYIVANGQIVNKLVKQIRYTNFPDKSFNKISHVRPHAKNALDTYPLPTEDVLTRATEYTKHCFWLNNSYIRDEIFLK